MSIALALNIPNQQQNASVGLIDSTDARYARSLVAGFNESPFVNFDSTYYNQGVAIKDALALSSSRLGLTYDEQQLRQARAVAFARGVGNWRLGTHFDQLQLNQAIAWGWAFGNTFTFEAEFFSSATDTSAGNEGGLTGTWTQVNPDVDVATASSAVVVGFNGIGEWLQWKRPLALLSGNYSVAYTYGRDGTAATATFAGQTFSLPATSGWGTLVSQTAIASLTVVDSTASFRHEFTDPMNLDKITLTRI